MEEETNDSAVQTTKNKYKKYKSLCVTERGGKVFCPPSIPKERGNSKVLSSVICTFLFIADVFTSDLPIKDILFLYSGGYILLFCLQVIERTMLLREELLHLVSRYQNSYLNMIKSVSSFSVSSLILLVVSFQYVSMMFIISSVPNYIINLNVIIFFVPVMSFLERIVDLKSCLLHDTLIIADLNGLDYGSGLAYSFFYGYLNLVLPKSGEESKNLAELMQDYEATHNIKFSVYKLFVLIPISCKCFVSLDNEFFPSVDGSISLPAKKITRAGVKDRHYHNAVYKITDSKNQKVYVSAEYATPLLTFKEALDDSGTQNVFYNKYKKEILLHFYLTLKKILKAKDLDKFCEVIFFEDSVQDINGTTTYYDVGKIILGRLNEMERHQDKKTD